MFEAQTRATLDALFQGDEKARAEGVAIFDHFDVEDQKSPIESAPDDDVIAWCDIEPATRYSLMAAVVAYYEGKDGQPSWRPLALRMLERAPDGSVVLRRLIERFHPMEYTGSLAAIMESRSRLLDQLPVSVTTAFPGILAEEGERLRVAIERERKRETAEDRSTDERFE